MSHKRIYKRNYDRRHLPIRDWYEVYEEFNRRNPDKPLTSVEAAKAYHSQAMRKLRVLMRLEQRRAGEF